MKLRTVQKQDYPAVAELIKTAFQQSKYGYQQEAELVAKIRQLPSYLPDLEVVAVNDHIIGHGLLSEAVITGNQPLTGLVLAPLAVAPEAQNGGVGSALLLKLEQRAQTNGSPFISILGDPDYYMKFGYQTAYPLGIQAPFEVPREAFLIKSLQLEPLPAGIIRYNQAFDA